MPRPCSCDRVKPDQPFDGQQCWLCWLYHNKEEYRRHWDKPGPSRTAAPKFCRFLGTVARDEDLRPITRDCPTCNQDSPGRVRLKVWNCSHPDEVKRGLHPLPTLQDCAGCADFEDLSVPVEGQPDAVQGQPGALATESEDLLDCEQATRELTVDQMVRLIDRAPPGPWPSEQRWHEGKLIDVPQKCWHTWDNTRAAHRLLARRFRTEEMPICPTWYSGQGIVIAGGGERYFPSVWVAVNKIRYLGCQLPIQVWYLGDTEMDPYTRRLLAGYGAEAIDARQVEKTFPARILCGWELKIYATMMSPFREVLFLDADSAPMLDPTELFESNAYRKTGAVYWPDFDCWEMDPGVWEIFDVQYRKERAFESGQYLIDKFRCWESLMMAFFFADHSDFYFRHVYGDKECYHFGHRYAGQDFAMPVRGPDWNFGRCIVQYHPDPEWMDTIAFLHRCGDKWNLAGNERVDLPDEDVHHGFVQQLREVWPGRFWANPAPNRDEQAAINRLAFTTFRYQRLPDGDFAGDERLLELLPGGRIGAGRAELESRWEVNLVVEGDVPVLILTLCSEKKPTVHLRVKEGWGPGWTFEGRWLEHERCTVRLVEYPGDPGTGPGLDPRYNLLLKDFNDCVAEIGTVLRKYGRKGSQESVDKMVRYGTQITFVSSQDLAEEPEKKV